MNQVRWTYGLMKADGGMDAIYSEGPIPSERLREVLGGEYEHVTFADETVVAIRKDREALPVNAHWRNPLLRGDVILGRMVEGQYVGMLGVAVLKEVAK